MTPAHYRRALANLRRGLAVGEAHGQRIFNRAECTTNRALLDHLEARLAEQITRRMKALHKYFHNQIGRGTYDHRLPIDADAPAPEAAAKPAPSSTSWAASPT